MCCPMCGEQWQNREVFIADRSLELTGYQADFDRLEMGLFFFTHKQEGCQSTLSMRAGEFYDLNPKVRYRQRKTLQDECPNYCLYQGNLEQCPAECECAFIRELILILQRTKFSGDERQGV